MASEYGMYENIVPLLAPIDKAGTAAATPWVDMKTAHSLSFLVYVGVITAATADAVVTVTVEAATAAATGSEAAVVFSYRLSDATGANAWGAVTAATTAGATFASTDDGKAMLVTVDPAAVQAAKADARWVRAVITPTDFSVCLVTALAVIDPRYKQTTMKSAT
jgi:hypothetical protein